MKAPDMTVHVKAHQPDWYARIMLALIAGQLSDEAWVKAVYLTCALAFGAIAAVEWYREVRADD